MNDADGRRRYTDQCGHKLFIGIDSFMLTLVAKSKRQPHPPFLHSLSHLKKKRIYNCMRLIESQLFLLPITQTSKTEERITTSLAFTLKEMTNGSYLFDESKNNLMDLRGSKDHTTRSLKYVPRLIQASI